MLILEPMKLAITVDNVATNLYVDGVRTPMPNYNDWKKVDIIIIPGDTRVIAVQAHDDGVSYIQFNKIDNVNRHKKSAVSK